MAEYINRDAVHDLVRSLTKYAWTSPPDNTGHRVTVDADDVNFGVDKIPSADVAQVRHGRWKRSGALLECQLCGEIYSQLGGNAGKSWNYCPNCGEKMDGGAD